MTRFLVTLACISLCPFVLKAQNYKKAVRFLEKGQHERAIAEFESGLDQNGSLLSGHYGLALARFLDQPSLDDFRTIVGHLKKAGDRLHKLSGQDQEELEEFRKVYDKNAFEAIEELDRRVSENLLRELEQTANLSEVNYYLYEYPNITIWHDLSALRVKLGYEEAKEQNTVQAYQAFLDQFPESEYVGPARRSLHQRAFEQAESVSTISGYQKFLLEFPESPQVEEARQQLAALEFEKAKKLNTLDAYRYYLAQYPESTHYPEALRQGQYLFLLESPSILLARDFIRKYPDWGPTDDIRQQLERLEAIYAPYLKKEQYELYYLEDYYNRLLVRKINGKQVLPFEEEPELLDSAQVLLQTTTDYSTVLRLLETKGEQASMLDPDAVYIASSKTFVRDFEIRGVTLAGQVIPLTVNDLRVGQILVVETFRPKSYSNEEYLKTVTILYYEPFEYVVLYHPRHYVDGQLESYKASNQEDKMQRIRQLLPSGWRLVHIDDQGSITDKERIIGTLYEDVSSQRRETQWAMRKYASKSWQNIRLELTEPFLFHNWNAIVKKTSSQPVGTDATQYSKTRSGALLPLRIRLE